MKLLTCTLSAPFFLCTGFLNWTVNQSDFSLNSRSIRQKATDGVWLVPMVWNSHQKLSWQMLIDGRMLASSRLRQIWHWIMDIIWPESDNDHLHPGSRKGRHVVCPIRCGRGSPWTCPLLSSAGARLLFSERTAAGTSQPPERDLERDATDSNGCWLYMEVTVRLDLLQDSL